MMLLRPYFMTNKKWYRFDYKKGIAVLTKDAPSEAVESYKQFYSALEGCLVRSCPDSETSEKKNPAAIKK